MIFPHSIIHRSNNRRIDQDTCALKQLYLINHDDFHHETNFHEFESKKCSKKNWNHHQSFMAQKDMEFTKRRFCNTFIYEYQLVEVDYGLDIKRPSQIRINLFKIKRNDQEKLKVCHSFLKWVKPTLFKENF